MPTHLSENHHKNACLFNLFPYNNVIKTTGAEANFSGIIAVSAVAFVMVAGGAFYLVKSKKERV